MKDLKIREAYVAVLYEFLSDISYHTRRSSHTSTLSVLRFIYKDLVKIMTPIIPHICEELYLGEDNNAYASLAALKTDSSKYINKQIEEIEGIVENLVATIARQKDSRNIREIKQITIVQASKQKFALFDKLKNY